MPAATAAMAAGSVSMRLYPHNDLDATAVIAELRAQAVLAVETGFDGVMTSEHHGAFAGYLPNPLQVSGWLLEAMPSGWAAPCPLLLPLRPPALVAEEVAWLAARFPGRVGVGLASGSLPLDFEIMGLDKEDLTDRFAAGLHQVAGALSGRDAGLLADDLAVRRCVENPVPVVSAAMGLTACRRAAAEGVGLVLDSLAEPSRCRQLVDTYREAGGTGPCVLIRRAWVGRPPSDRQARQRQVYESYSSPEAMAHWKGEQQAVGEEPAAVAAQLAEAVVASGADALNLRVHVPGVEPSAARDQIARLGSEVVPALRRALLPVPG